MAEIEVGATEQLAHEGVKGGAGCVVYVQDGAAADCGKSVRLTRGAILIGTDPACDLVLTDTSVSRRHAELGIYDEGIQIQDLGSTNGIVYLGQRITKGFLQRGARLQLGRTSLDVLPLTSDAHGLPLSQRDSYGPLFGGSDAMRRVYTMLELLESTDAPVLLHGETGTGKELAARAIHEHSARRQHPFVVVDCGSVPATLIESELFGHKKGAFTGATTDRAGAFATAHQGTIFLDEIAELPIELQPRLLRALESGEVKAVGEERHRRVDVRVVAATHRNLEEGVKQRTFREDLFYRLAVVRIDLPPLRERRQDIPTLASRLCAQLDPTGTKKIPPAALDFMMRYDWPGNVRELRNAVHRVLALGAFGLQAGGAPSFGQGIEPAQEPAALPNIDSSVAFKEARERAIATFEQAYLKDLMEKAGGKLHAASRAAEVDRKHLRNLMRKYGLYETLMKSEDGGDES